MTNLDEAIKAAEQLVEVLRRMRDGRPKTRAHNPANVEERARRDRLARGRMLRYLQSAGFERATKSELTRYVVADAGRNAGERVLAELITAGAVAVDGGWYVHGPRFVDFQE
jgi:hypothetical protein